MPAKTFNPAGASDNWSTAAAWGGSIPADGDSFTITAGKTCYMDTDQSTMGTGMIAGTINGTLRGPNGNGLGYLKMSGTAGQDITVASNGSIIHGDSKVSPAISGSYLTINLGTASEIYAGGSDRTIQLYPTMKTIRHIRLAADAPSGSPSIVADQTNAALQADGWKEGDYLSIARPTTSSSPNAQLLTILSWGGGSTINLSIPLAGGTFISGSYAVNHSSNIKILTSRTAGTEAAINCNYQCPTLDIGANIINTSVVSNYTNAGGAGISAFINSLGRGEFYGSVHGALYGVNYCRGLAVNGAYFTQHNTAVQRSIKSYLHFYSIGNYITSSSTTADCYMPEGTIVFGNVYAVGGYGNMQFGGEVKGCLDGFIGFNGYILPTSDIGGTADIDKNQNGSIDFSDGGNIVLNGAMLQDSTKMYLYKNVVMQPNTKSAVAMYNYASSIGTPQVGQHWFYTTGGYTQPTSGPGFSLLGYPSIEKMTFEWYKNLNFIDLPTELTIGQPFSMTFDIQLGSGSYIFLENPAITLVDPNYPFEISSGTLYTAKTPTGGGIDTYNTDIQRLYISYVPPVSSNAPYGAKKPATVRVKGRGGNYSGSGTDYMLFAYSQTNSVVADIRSINGSAVPVGNLENAYNGYGYSGGTIKQNVNVSSIDSSAVTSIASGSWHFNLDGTYDAQQLMRVMAAVLGGQSVVSGSNIIFKSLDGTTTRVNATTDGSGSRISVLYSV
jgi:hypothetical protein